MHCLFPVDVAKLTRSSPRKGLKREKRSVDSIVHIDDGEISFKKKKSAGTPYEIVNGGESLTHLN